MGTALNRVDVVHVAQHGLGKPSVVLQANVYLSLDAILGSMRALNVKGLGDR